MERRSSQLMTQLMQLRKESLKKFRLEFGGIDLRDSNPDLCDNGAALVCGVSIFSMNSR